MTTIIQPLSPFSNWQGLAITAGTAEAPVGFSGIAAVVQATLPGNGEIFGIGINLSALLTAGNIFVRAAIGGVALTTLLAMNAGTGSDAFFRITDSNRFFVAGQQLTILVSSDGAQLPTPMAVVAVVPHLILNRGISTDEQGI